jgi:hypothetical protein
MLRPLGRGMHRPYSSDDVTTIPVAKGFYKQKEQ